jgi:hypothetical protein
MNVENVQVGNRELSDVLLLVGSTLAVVATVTPLTDMLVRAWTAEGFGHTVVWAVVDATPLTLESAVVLPLGIAAGLVAMFALDRTKLVQALLLVAAAGPLLATVWYNGLWFGGRIDWVANAPWGAAGLLVGALIGTADKTIAALTDRDALGVGRREFPVAAGALFVAAVGFAVVGFLDAALSAGGSAVTTAVDLAVSVAFVGFVGFLIQYRDRRDVAVLSPNRSAETLVICGLFAYVDDRYRTVVSAGEADLNRLSSNLAAGRTVSTTTDEIAFNIHGGGWFDNWTSVSTSGYANRHLLDEQVARAAESTAAGGRGSLLAHRFGRALTRETPLTFVDQLLTFDVVLLVVPLDKEPVRRAFDPDVVDEDVETVDFLDRYRRFIEATSGRDPTVVVVATGGETALTYFESEYGGTTIDSPELRNEVAHRFGRMCSGLEADEPFPVTPIVVSQSEAAAVDDGLAGADQLWHAVRDA